MLNLYNDINKPQLMASCAVQACCCHFRLLLAPAECTAVANQGNAVEALTTAQQLPALTISRKGVVDPAALHITARLQNNIMQHLQRCSVQREALPALCPAHLQMAGIPLQPAQVANFDSRAT
jgi:hypothetical protein